MRSLTEIRKCKIHGETLFTQKHNAKGAWWVCHECLKLQWRNAQIKRRSNPDVIEYQKQFNKEKALITKSLSLTLRVILLAMLLKPE